MALIASARERPFGADELFAWTADSAGRFRAADAVFARLTGVEAEALAGQTHALVRHPEMPVALLPPRPSPAYVKHLAEDGASFWALVLTTRVGDGFVGVGLKPDGPSFDAARERLRAIRDASSRARRSTRPRHDAFARAAFVAEIEARVPGRSAHADVVALLAAAGKELARVGGLFEGAQARRDFVEELAESIRLFSLNAILAAHRLADSAAIGAVAGLLQTRSEAAVPDLIALADEIEQAAGAHAEARFAVAAARLLAERPDVPEALAARLEAVAAATTAFDAAFDRLAAAVTKVEDHFKTIRFLELQGRIEAARATDTGHVLTLFEEIGRQVRAAGTELAVFAQQPDRAGVDTARAMHRRAAELRAKPDA